MSEYSNANKYPWIGFITLLEKDERIITYGLFHEHVPFIIKHLPFVGGFAYFNLDKYYYVALTNKRIILCREPQKPDKFNYYKWVPYQNAEINRGKLLVKFNDDIIEELEYAMDKYNPAGLNRTEFSDIFHKQWENLS
jgi:hypothetical protein